jgi:hypothetical protein
MAQRIQLRRGTSAAWTAANPTLAQGEMGVETDTNRSKIGDGASPWSALPYAGSGASPSAHMPLEIPVYDANPSVGHPDVVYVPGGWNGYAYWMAFTPFPSSLRENPSIVASNDGVNWEVPPGLTNPIASLADAVAAGYDYWADTEMVLDGSTMVLYFKGTKTAVSNHYLRTTSTDGVTWSTPTVVITDAGVSPAVIIEPDGTYTMIELKDNIARRTSTDGITWTAATLGTRPTLPSPFGIWHLDATRDSQGTYHALITASVPTGTAPYRLFYWTSTNGLTWTGDTSPSVPLSGSRFDAQGHYRSAIMPAASGIDGRFDLWLTGMDDTGTNHDQSIWRIGLIRDFDFSAPNGGDAWAFPVPSAASFPRSSDEIWISAGELQTTLGAPPAGPVPGSGWPAKGLRHNASDGLGVVVPPLPTDWHHFTIDALIVNGGTLSGGFVLPTRHQIAGAGDTITTGTFRQLIATMGAQDVPTWFELLGYPAVAPIGVQQGKATRITIERSWGNVNDTIDDTLWILALRVRRVRRLTG